MGALWTKERYAKCVSFMERTDVVECGSSRKTLRPTDRNVIYARLKVIKDNAPIPATAAITPPTGKVFKLKLVPAPAAVTPKTVREVFGPSPKEKAQDLINLGYKDQGGSIDSEVRDLKKAGHTGSRDLLRAAVKIIRVLQGGSK
jgi:hypothetical protein